MTFALAHLGTSWHILAPLRAWPHAGPAVCPSASEKLCSFLQVSVARLARYNCASAACKQFVTATACHSLSSHHITFHMSAIGTHTYYMLHSSIQSYTIYTIYTCFVHFCPKNLCGRIALSKSTVRVPDCGAGEAGTGAA